jgi:hypothetical protein
MTQEQFKSWAMVELFGHTRIAGEVSEQTIAGGAMVRIDVPETETSPGFTRIVNVAAIYAINPMSEESARLIAGRITYQPVDRWDIQHYVKQAQLKLQESTKPAENISEEEDELPFN